MNCATASRNLRYPKWEPAVWNLGRLLWILDTFITINVRVEVIYFVIWIHKLINWPISLRQIPLILQLSIFPHLNSMLAG